MKYKNLQFFSYSVFASKSVRKRIIIEQRRSADIVILINKKRHGFSFLFCFALIFDSHRYNVCVCFGSIHNSRLIKRITKTKRRKNIRERSAFRYYQSLWFNQNKLSYDNCTTCAPEANHFATRQTQLNASNSSKRMFARWTKLSSAH